MAKKNESSESCCSCKFWNAPEDETATVGQCRAHPPTVVVRAAAESSFPLTQDSDWCGEFVGGAKAHEKTHEKAHESHAHAKSAH